MLDRGILCESPFAGMFSFLPKPWKLELMPKKAGDDRAEKDAPRTEQAAPPLLSEKLIAQLQHAVAAARRKRTPAAEDASANGT